MAVLTDEQQPFVGTIGVTGMSTAWARLAGIMGIHFDRHTSLPERFVGNHALQFGKGPPGEGRIGLPLLLRGFFAMRAAGTFMDVCQLFQTDEAMGVGIEVSVRVKNAGASWPGSGESRGSNMVEHLEIIGQVVGDYRLRNWLGGGSLGNVYLAEHVRNGQQVAVKILQTHLLQPDENHISFQARSVPRSARSSISRRSIDPRD